MEAIGRGTTPDIPITIEDGTGLLGADWYHVTFKNLGRRITKSQDECTLSVDGKTVTVSLTQAETLSLKKGSTVEVQIRFGGAGKAWKTETATLGVTDVLEEGVIEWTPE